MEANFPDTLETIMPGTWVEGWWVGDLGRRGWGSFTEDLGLHQSPKGEPRLHIDGEKASGGRACGGGDTDGVVKKADPEGTGCWCLVSGGLVGHGRVSFCRVGAGHESLAKVPKGNARPMAGFLLGTWVFFCLK